MFGWSSEHYPRKSVARVFALLTQEAVIKEKAMRASIDMKAFVSLKRKNQYKSLRLWDLLRKPDMEMSQSDRKMIAIVKIEGTNSVHKLYLSADH